MMLYRDRSRSRGGSVSLTQRLHQMFGPGLNGAMYDYADMKALYQDSAGTTPVAVVTDPVGKSLDTSGNTNHALQATAGARPTWTNRVNMLGYSEDLTRAIWQNFGTTITGTNQVNFPSINTYIVNAANTPSIDAAAGTTGTFTVKLSGAGTLYIGVSDNIVGISYAAIINLSATPTEYSVSRTSGGNGRFTALINRQLGTATSVLVEQPRLNYGLTSDRYQSITTAASFDTAGFPYYLSFLGTDDSLTSATGGGGSAGFFWCGVVRPTGGAGTLRTLFADNGTNTGYKVQIDVNNKLSFSAGDNAAFTTKVSTAALSVGPKYMLTVRDTGAVLSVQIDSAAPETVARPVVVAGTAGFTIGKDNGAASSYLIGNLHASVYFKNTGLTDAQVANVQAWVRAKAGV